MTIGGPLACTRMFCQQPRGVPECKDEPVSLNATEPEDDDDDNVELDDTVEETGSSM